VRDEAGRPVVGARITLQPTSGSWWAGPPQEVHAVTDGEGIAAFKVRHPDPEPLFEGWSVNMSVEAEGFAPRRDWLHLFPGAVVEREVILHKATTTIIRLLGPDRAPLPGAEFSISYADADNYLRIDPARANEKGEYALLHGPLRWPIFVRVGRYYESCRDAPEVEVVLSEDEIPAGSLDRRLVLKLITSGGAPAAGWFVAPDAKESGADGLLGGEMVHHSVAESLERVGLSAEGAAEVVLERLGEHLAIISPEGALFIYPLAPKSWPAGERRVTLQLPPVRRMHAGRVVREDGGVAAGLGVVAGDSVRFLGRYRSLGIGGPYLFGPPQTPLWRAAASDGTPVGSFFTDAEGRFEVPVYAGARIAWSVVTGTRDRRWIDLDSPEGEVRVEQGQDWRLPAKLKCVTFDFRDERGRRIEAMSLSCGGWVHSDSRGVSVFVKIPVDDLKIETHARGWRPLEVLYDVSAPEDQEIRLTMPDSLRLPPLAGRVLDADGRPVEGASVSLYETGKSPRPGQRSYLGLNAETDAEGRFSFDAAPDECFVALRRDDPDGYTRTLPGWLDEPFAVTAADRDVTIRLKRAGSVRILLPAGTSRLQRHLSLSGEERPGEEPFARRHHPKHDVGGASLSAPFVRPGRYEFLASYPEGDHDLRGVAGIAVDVAAGEEAVVDLRAPGHYPPLKLPRAPVDISVTHDGRPVSGAVVKVYAVPEKDAPDGTPTIRASNLSDDAGNARFDAVKGRRYFAFARALGRLVGWRTFAAADRSSVEIEMVPAISLAVRVGETVSSHEVRIRMPGIDEDEAAALLAALGIHRPLLLRLRGGERREEAKEGLGFLSSEGPAGFVAEDLPAGHAVLVEVLDRVGGEVLARREETLSAEGGPVHELSIEMAR
jgi:hypothetical protein